MWTDTRLIELLGIEHPIIQAPMASATGPELVAAVSNAGGLGSFGAAGTPPARLRGVVQAIRQRTEHSFNVNLFSSHTEHYDREARPGPRLTQQLQRYHQELGLGAVPDPAPMFGPAEEQLQVLLDAAVPVISFHFGVDNTTVERARSAGARVLCSATTVAEARILEQAGVDAIIAQGSEAGGHRGTFNGHYKQAMIGTLALVPQIVDAVCVPVIAAGGVMDARALVACLALGAAGVQMGTAFLGCPEAPIATAWREALKTADGESTTVTEAISGKPARGIRNRYVEDIESLNEPLLPYPAQYSVSRELRKAATDAGDPRFMAMWSGQGAALIRNQPAELLVGQLVAESHALMRRLGTG